MVFCGVKCSTPLLYFTVCLGLYQEVPHVCVRMYVCTVHACTCICMYTCVYSTYVLIWGKAAEFTLRLGSHCGWVHTAVGLCSAGVLHWCTSPSVQCPVCRREFMSADFLQSHIARRHPEHLSAKAKCVCVCMRVSVCVCVCVCACVCVCVCMCACVCTCACLCVCMCYCTYASVCVLVFALNNSESLSLLLCSLLII